MAKKYLTLEEAARQLGMAPDELVRLRERSEIRGFADRGTWKFRSEDVDEFARSRDADSSPEVPIIDDVKGRKGAAGDSGIRKGSSSGRFNKTSDSDVRLLLDETLVPGGKESDPDVVLSQLGTGDSDVRLSDDVGGLVDSASDSDVKLISTSSEDVLPSDAASSDASDSDVKLVSSDSDSDVRLAKPEAKAPGSDSDVRLVGTEEMATHHSDSDVRLTAPGSSMDLVGSGPGSSGSHIKLGGTSSVNLGDSSSDESSVLLAQDSGIALDTGSGMKVGGGSSADSGITLQSLADSGISLEKSDSGITLAGPMDSGIALDADSGIALESDTDSGIALSADSGIALDADSGTKAGKPAKKKEEKKEKKEKKPQRRDEREEKTISAVSGSDDFDDESTQVEVNMMDGEEDSSYKLHDDENEKTNVVLFADDDEESEDEPVAPPVKAKKGRVDDSFALQEQESGVEFAEAEDFSDDEDLEVAEDVLTEDEGDLDEIDVFEPAEEDFDSSVQSGESHAELAPVMAMRSPVAVETPWDGLTFGILAVSSVCLLLAGVMMYDLVRTEWYFDGNVVVGTSLIDWVRGLFPTT
jgi:excisionase family DNA binding protein